jgi:hypothetical protein
VLRFAGADGNGDRKVNREDYQVWKDNYGEKLPMPEGASVSEALAASAGEPQFASISVRAVADDSPIFSEGPAGSGPTDAAFADFRRNLPPLATESAIRPSVGRNSLRAQANMPLTLRAASRGIVASGDTTLLLGEERQLPRPASRFARLSAALPDEPGLPADERQPAKLLGDEERSALAWDGVWAAWPRDARWG